jgi:hypothetical protein
MPERERNGHDDFTPQQAQARFEATLRGALNTPPQHKPAKPPSNPRPKKGTATGAGRKGRRSRSGAA